MNRLRKLLAVLLSIMILLSSMPAGVFAEGTEAGHDHEVEVVTEAPAEEPTEEPTAEPTEEPTPEPAATSVEEPVAETIEEPVAETIEEPVAEATEEPVAETTVEPVVEATEEPVAETTVEPVAEATEEPVVEATVEPVAETTEEPVVEATEEPAAEDDGLTVSTAVLELAEDLKDTDSELSAALFAAARTRAACAHANLYVYHDYDWNEDLQYTPVDAVYHTYTIQYTSSEVYCGDCGDTIAKVPTNRTETIKEFHLVPSDPEDGRYDVCYYCRRKLNTKCTHANLFFYTGSETKYVYFDADRHTVETITYYEEDEEYSYRYANCLDCSALVSVDSEGVVRKEYDGGPSYEDFCSLEAHEYVDGVCLCGASCPHPEDQLIITEDESRYSADHAAIDGNDDDHTLTVTRCYTTACGVCGKTLKENEEKTVSTTEAHAYEGSSCSLCGYECAHAGLYWHYWYTETGYADSANFTAVTNREHLYHGPGTRTATCGSCEQEFSESVDVFNLYEDHNYEDGTCVSCGHENTCEHPDARVNGLNTSGNDHANPDYYVSVDRENHMYIGPGDLYYYCSDCGVSYGPVSLESAGYESEHEFENGVCTVCGAAEQINTCAHENTYEVCSPIYGDTDPVYTDLGDGTHLVEGSFFADVYCNDCGSCISSVEVEYGEFVQDHDLKSEPCNDCLVCAGCGYHEDKPDDHPNLQVKGYTAQPHDLADPENYIRTKDGHTYHGPIVQYGWCPDCEENIKVNVRFGSLSEYTGFHTFASDNVSCAICGFIADCAHEDAAWYKETPTDEDNSARYTDGGKNGHTYNGPADLYGYCPDCGENVVRHVNHFSLSEDHTYGGGTVCTRCGRENTCAHEEFDTIETFPNYALATKADFTAISPLEHTYTGPVIQWGYCSCGASERYPARYQSLTLPHVYEDDSDVCRDCGYAGAAPGCAHERVNVYNDVADYHSGTYTHAPAADGSNAVYAATHTYSGTYDVVTYCCDCERDVSRVTTHGTFTEEHDWADAVCEACGVNESDCAESVRCAHENAEWDGEVHPDAEQLSKPECYAPSDDDRHLFVGQGSEYGYCPDCKENVHRIVKNLSVPMEHCYADAASTVCALCGCTAACAHADARWTEIPVGAYYSQYTPTEHKAAGRFKLTGWCSDCEKEITRFVNSHTATESHRFVDGLSYCKDCGYESDCTHPNLGEPCLVYDEADLANPAYSAPGSLKHHVYNGPAMLKAGCSDCGAYVVRQVQAHGHTVKHTYAEDGSGCLVCGQADACKHPNLRQESHSCDDPFNPDFFEIVSVGSHRYVGPGEIIWWCMDCDRSFPERVDNLGLEWIHEYEEGGTVCINCGYRGVCSHILSETFCEYDGTWTDNYDGTCTFSGVVRENTLCSLCGALKFSSSSEETFTQKHQRSAFEEIIYDDMAVCMNCSSEFPAATRHPGFEPRSWTISDADLLNPDFYGYANGDVHYYTGPMDVYGYCPHCSKDIEISLMFNNRISVPMNHLYRTGSSACVYCGYEDSCAHADVEWEEMPLWTADDPASCYTITPSRHVYDGPGAYYGYCFDCEQALIRPMEDNLMYADWHMYESTDINGNPVCSDCGHVNKCTHPELYIVRSSIEITDAEPLEDGRHHLATGVYTEDFICAVCEEWLDSVEAEAPGQFYEEHNYEDGLCVDCGYEPGCRHESTRVVYKPLDNSIPYISCDNASHFYDGPCEYAYICVSCGETADSGVCEDGFYADHEYGANGVCTLCGHEDGCDHADLELQPDVAPGTDIAGCIESWDEYGHIYTGPGVLSGECPDCGRVFSEAMDESVTLELAHLLVDGECVHCSFVNTCRHPEEYLTTSIVPEDDCEAVYSDARHHILSGDYIEYLSCTACGDALVVSRHSGTTLHEHDYYDEGECMWCGYVNSCTHENAVLTPSVDYAFEDEFTYEIASDSAHAITGPGWLTGQCGDCGKWIYVEQTVTAYEEHSIDTFGLCALCSYSVACAHPSGSIISVSAPDEGHAAPCADGKNHSFTGSYTVLNFCTECGCMVSSRAVTGSFEEPHTFANGVCAVCEYETACEHPNAYTWVEHRTLTDAVYVNAASHCYSGSRHMVGFCSDCNTEINELMELRTDVYEAHIPDENGYCVECGHLIECQHRMATESVQMDYENASITYYDELRHAVKGDLIKITSCPTCSNLHVDQTVVQSGVTFVEAHYFGESGACLDCGYINPYVADCEHCDTASESYIMPLWYENVDSTGHNVYGYSYEATICYECGMISMSDLDRSEIVVDFVEHTLSEGICTDCFYNEGCAHLDVLYTGYGEDLGVTAISPYQHAVTVVIYACKWCPDCAITFNPVVESVYTRYDDHTFFNGYYCDTCYYYGPIAPKSVSVKSSLTLGVGQSTMLSATVKPANATSAVTYKSSNTNVAAVNAYGKIVAKKAGTATITVTCGSKKATCKVTVKKAPTKISLSPTSAKLGVGMTGKLKYTLSSGSVAEVKFLSSNENVATVSASGVITAVGVGRATIGVVTHNNVKATMTLTVYPGPSSVTLNKTSVTLGVGQYDTLKAAGNSGTMGTFSFRSLNPDVLIVDSAGKIKAAKPGVAAVLARATNGASAVCTVTVKAAPSRVIASPAAMTIGVGQTSAISVQLGADGEDCAGSFSFSTKSSKIATVSASGVVTGKKTGTTYITVKSHNGKAATVKVVVVKAPSSIKLSGLTLGVGETGKMKYTLSSGSAASLRYASSNAAVATIDADGFVTAHSVGKTTITVKTHNGKKATATVVVKAAPESVTMNATSLTIGVGQYATLKAAVNSGAAGAIAFESLNGSVLLASSAGKIKGVAPGTATLRAYTYNGEEALCEVTVKAAPSRVIASPAAMTIGVGQTSVISVQLGADGEDCAGSFSFSTKSSKIATVSASGVVTGKKTGTTYITVKSHNGKAATVKVVVVKAPTSIKLSGLTLGVGETGKMKYTLSSGSAASLRYASSNAAVATIDADGFVTAHSVGKTTITVKTHNGKKTTATVVVKAAPESVTMNATSLTIGVGQYATLKAAVNSGAAGAITFESLNGSALLASSAGKIKGIAPGTATLRAYTYNGEEALCEVTVKAAPSKVSLNLSKGTMRVGKTYQLDVTLGQPGEDCAGSCTFASSNTKVATVSATGVITARKAGTATITVKTHNGKKATCVITVKK